MACSYFVCLFPQGLHRWTAWAGSWRRVATAASISSWSSWFRTSPAISASVATTSRRWSRNTSCSARRTRMLHKALRTTRTTRWMACSTWRWESWSSGAACWWAVCCSCWDSSEEMRISSWTQPPPRLLQEEVEHSQKMHPAIQPA